MCRRCCRKPPAAADVVCRHAWVPAAPHTPPSFPVQVLARHDISAVSWQACVLPTRQHALCLRVAEGTAEQPTELLLRAKSKEHVQQAVQQLAEHARRAAGSQDSELEAAALEARLLAAGAQCPVPSRPAANPSLQVPADEPAGPDPRSLSFGSPVADMASGSWRSCAAGGCGAAAGQGSRADSPAALLEELKSEWDSEEEADVVCGGDGSGGGSDSNSYGAGGTNGVRQQPEAAGCTQAAAAAHGSHLLTSRSAPTSPVLPGLPLVASMAGTGAAATRRPSASAPTSPSQAVVEGVEAQASPPPPSQLLPVRLLSFSGRPGGSSVQSHIQRLEAAVAQLGSELARSRSAAGSLAASPSTQTAQGLPAAAEALALEEREQPAVDARPLGRMPLAASKASNASPANTSGGKGSSERSRQAEALAQENALLREQLAAMQAELVRMQGQLSAAAADNIRLASQAAAAVAQLAAAADAMRGGQQREHELRASLAAAVGQCEAVGRELAGLSARMEAKEAQCWELRCAGLAGNGSHRCSLVHLVVTCCQVFHWKVGPHPCNASQQPLPPPLLQRRSTAAALSEDKTVLTAALTTAQLQLKEATPAGFAAETAELRRQAEAARNEAATARAEAAVAAGKAAEAARREAEVGVAERPVRYSEPDELPGIDMSCAADLVARNAAAVHCTFHTAGRRTHTGGCALHGGSTGGPHSRAGPGAAAGGGGPLAAPAVGRAAARGGPCSGIAGGASWPCFRMGLCAAFGCSCLVHCWRHEHFGQSFGWERQLACPAHAPC